MSLRLLQINQNRAKKYKQLKLCKKISSLIVILIKFYFK